MKLKMLFFALFFYATSFSQNAYLDAIKINTFKTTQGNLSLLNDAIKDGHWTPDSTSKEKRSELEEFLSFLNSPLDFRNNETIDIDNIFTILKNVQFPVLESLQSHSETKSNSDYGTETISSLSKNDKINNAIENIEKLGGVSEIATPSGLSLPTKIIDGAAKFLVDRTKRELTITFFDKFQNKLDRNITVPIEIDGDKINIDVKLKSILPHTYLLLESKDFFDVPSLGKTWITAFKKDLNELPISLEKMLKSNPNFSKTQKGAYILSIFDLVTKLEAGYHPMEIIKELSLFHNDYSNNKTDVYLGLVNLISNNSYKYDNSKLKKWITIDDFNILSEDEKKYFIALICQKGVNSGLFKNIKFNNSGRELSLERHILFMEYEKFYSAIKNILINFRRTENLLKNARENKNDLKNYLEYMNSVHSIIDNTVENTYRIYSNNAYYTSDYYQKYSPITKGIIEISSTLNNENYGESLLIAIKFLNQIPDHKKDNESKEQAYSDFTKKLSYYGNFLVDIIEAAEDKEADVKDIIDNYALPVGSYRIKRRYNSSWDVSAYPGLYIGYEFSKSESSNFGVTAPIGFSYSWKNKDKVDSSTGESKGASSNSIFVSAIDITAPFSYRFANDEAEGLPEDIKWDQIFAPGIFYVYGFKNSPLALSIGGQFTPLLRKIETNNILDDENVFRFQLGLTVDIPIFNLKRSSK